MPCHVWSSCRLDGTPSCIFSAGIDIRPGMKYLDGHETATTLTNLTLCLHPFPSHTVPSRDLPHSINRFSGHTAILWLQNRFYSCRC